METIVLPPLITEPVRIEKVTTPPIVDNRGKSIYLDLGLCPAGKVRKMLKFRYRFTTLRYTITRFTRTKADLERDTLKLTFETEEDSDRMREQLKKEPMCIKHYSIRYWIRVIEKCDTIQESNTEHMDTEEKRSIKRKIHPDEHYRTKKEQKKKNSDWSSGYSRAYGSWGVPLH